MTTKEKRKSYVPANKKRINFFISNKLYEQLLEIGEYNGLDTSALINVSISNYIKEQKLMLDIYNDPKLREMLLNYSSDLSTGLDSE